MKPDFEKAAKEYTDAQPINKGLSEVDAFVAGCEYAYSIDKETIERLEKENKEMQEKCLLYWHYRGSSDNKRLEFYERDIVKLKAEIERLTELTKYNVKEGKLKVNLD